MHQVACAEYCHHCFIGLVVAGRIRRNPFYRARGTEHHTPIYTGFICDNSLASWFSLSAGRVYIFFTGGVGGRSFFSWGLIFFCTTIFFFFICCFFYCKKNKTPSTQQKPNL